MNEIVSEPGPQSAVRVTGLSSPPGDGSADSLFDLAPGHIQAPDRPPRYTDLWSRISAGLRLQEYYARPEVREQLRLFAGRPDYFKLVGERARPFLHNIVQQIDQRDLPMEIALIPFVESGFNPHAQSPKAATGPWQFMAATGRSLGLRVDEWFDGRRDPIQATTAALDYLEIQRQRFQDNWLLAFAAYNSGPATVNRALRATAADGGDIDFWELSLPTETRIHVPRILALASILAGAGELEFALPAIADEAALQRVEVGVGASLLLAAELAGLEPKMLRDLNPGFRQWWTPPDGGPNYLNLPMKNAQALRLALQQAPDAIQVNAVRYRIQSGDTLSGIARTRSIPIELLRSRNDLSGDLIVAGEYLWIPKIGPEPMNQLAAVALAEPIAPIPEATPALHTVRPGDSLWAIARRYRLNVDALARENGISPSDIILPGQRLRLLAAAGNGAGTSAKSDFYRILPGDSLSRIAARFDKTLEEILFWNSLKADELIFPGQMLRVAPPN